MENRRMLDDIARLATSAAGVLQGTAREAETLMRQRLERLLDRMDLVPRDEFEAVKAMAAAARAENEELGQRVAKLEAAIQEIALAEKVPPAAARRRSAGTGKKPARKPTTRRKATGKA
ncbi:MAG TPA: accessory factor UbiK family protein [Alphaproteobacteria bacterium]|nr:accessory factor UbiK family protein [Alphaproteobacteria bacterium]